MSLTAVDRSENPLKDLVDFDWLDRYTGADPDFELELLGLFEQQAIEQIAQLRCLIGSEDVEAWHLASHTLKGTARSIGVGAVSKQAEQLEDAGPQAAQAMLVSLLDELSGVLRRFQAGLAQYRGNDLK